MSAPAVGADEFGTAPLFTDPLTVPERPSPQNTAADSVPVLFQEPAPKIFRSQNPANEGKTR
jgi:hypothetical protein